MIINWYVFNRCSARTRNSQILVFHSLLPSCSSFKLERSKSGVPGLCKLARQDTLYSSVLICYIFSVPSIFSTRDRCESWNKNEKREGRGEGEGKGYLFPGPPPFLSFVTLIPTFASSSRENALLTTQAVTFLINLIAYTVSSFPPRNCIQRNDRQSSKTAGGEKRYELYSIQCLPQSTKFGEFFHWQSCPHSHVRFRTFY